MIHKNLLVTCILLANTYASEINFKYKTIEDFKPLSTYKSMEEFEKNYYAYEQNCMDNSMMYLRTMKCFLSDDLWHRELNIHYKKLMSKLANKEKSNLEKNQESWTQSKDLSFELIRNKHFNNDIEIEVGGTSRRIIKAHSITKEQTKIIKERVLFLKDLYEKIH